MNKPVDSGRLLEYSRRIESISMDRLHALVDAIRTTAERGSHIFVCGNGGSCANAAHLVLHLRELLIRSSDLTADIAFLTAAANDGTYDAVFSSGLHANAIPGDVLVVISGSGNSKNIIQGLETANCLGLRTMGLLGFSGGQALKLCDIALIVDSSEYGPVEVAHDACIHLIKELLMAS